MDFSIADAVFGKPRMCPFSSSPQMKQVQTIINGETVAKTSVADVRVPQR